jgi:hypothetical protein
MELIAGVLFMAIKILLDVIIITLLAGITGFGLSIGYFLGKSLIGKVVASKKERTLKDKHKEIIDDFAGAEQNPQGA